MLLPPNPSRSVTELLGASGTTAPAFVLLGLFKLNKSNSESKEGFEVFVSIILGDLTSDFLATSFGLCLSLKPKKDIFFL